MFYRSLLLNKNQLVSVIIRLMGLTQSHQIKQTAFTVFLNIFRVVEKVMTTATKVFLDSCISIEQNQSYLADLNELIRKEVEVLERNNSETSSQKCKTILNGLWEPLESKMNESFVIPGAIQATLFKFKIK